MVSKGDLGVSYLVAVGVVLFGVFSVGVLRPFGSGTAMESRSLLGLSMGIMIAGSFLVTGVGLARSTLDDERVWRVAGWSTLGLGVPTLLAVVVVLLAPSLLRGIGWRSVVIVDIAAGGVVGVLVGSLLELRAEHERTRTLNQRNTVFLRLFRHDIRTSLNLIRGHLKLVVTDGSTPLQSADVIRDHLAHIERLSDAAKRLDDLESMVETVPVNFGALVRDRIDELRQSTDSVTVETDIDETHVAANELLSSVVDNLLRNAVEHGSTSNRTGTGDAVEHGSTGSESEADGGPWLRVTVQPTDGGDAVRLRIEDDGPGFTDAELAVHADARATETALQHSDGVGLWLVRWIVDAYDGRVDIGNADDGGAVVTVTLPRADEPPTGASVPESTPSAAENGELAPSR
ncbi:sensor histidine kinase [Haloplanus natans]|uniref:sensor histidine kinase n=1 Tax=Haloplanus natans TaxID=376171 RepID=UPI0006782AA8|nr:HAMP domain-containing sensor histidine kinase [Haloplanus natans]